MQNLSFVDCTWQISIPEIFFYILHIASIDIYYKQKQ